jgi:hypothetical protein
MDDTAIITKQISELPIIISMIISNRAMKIIIKMILKKDRKKILSKLLSLDRVVSNSIDHELLVSGNLIIFAIIIIAKANNNKKIIIIIYIGCLYNYVFDIPYENIY